jgi:hypothetical protein
LYASATDGRSAIDHKKLDEPPLKGVEIVTELTRESGKDKTTLGDNANLCAKSTNFLGIVTAEECRNILAGGQFTKKASSGRVLLIPRSDERAMGVANRQEVGRRLNNRAENLHQPFRRREEHEDSAEIQLNSRPGPQSFQSGASPRRP